jgi:hypothetical protein
MDGLVITPDRELEIGSHRLADGRGHAGARKVFEPGCGHVKPIDSGIHVREVVVSLATLTDS